eukprot:GHVS01103504.1.p1 GENE.GHVS01103504.1~~GHVS01103504.1.p1  ORF type:complete len:186 (-),score=61.41 GHVS01103504.1:27-584(-)
MYINCYLYVHILYFDAIINNQVVAIEGTFAAIFGAPLVGVLSEKVFGYEKTSQFVADMPDDLRLQNANALATSLSLLTIIPWCLSFFLYACLYFSYAHDQRALIALLKAEYMETDEEDDGLNQMEDEVEEEEAEAEVADEGEGGGEGEHLVGQVDGVNDDDDGDVWSGGGRLHTRASFTDEEELF